MAKRHKLPDAAWDLLTDLFTEPRSSGRPRADDRLMLNGVLGALFRRGLASHARALRPCRRCISAFVTGAIDGKGNGFI